MVEIEKYKEEIIRKANIGEEEFQNLLLLIFKKIKISTKEEHENYIEGSKKLIDDMKDIPFMAVALSLNVDGIWSDDPHFDKQDKIKNENKRFSWIYLNLILEK